MPRGIRGAYNRNENVKTCSFCGNKIYCQKDHFVLIGTYNRVSKPDDQQFFHFQCFVNYWNKKVEERARINVQYMQGKVMELIKNPMIINTLAHVQGADKLIAMASRDLDIQDPKFEGLKSKLRDKIHERGKPKRKANKRKSK